MRKLFIAPNIVMFAQLLLSAIVTLTLVLFKSYEAYVIVLLQLSSVIGILGVRFAEPISEFWDKLVRSFVLDIAQDSDKVALFFTKVLSYVFIIVQIVFLFVTFK